MDDWNEKQLSGVVRSEAARAGQATICPQGLQLLWQRVESIVNQKNDYSACHANEDSNNRNHDKTSIKSMHGRCLLRPIVIELEPFVCSQCLAIRNCCVASRNGETLPIRVGSVAENKVEVSSFYVYVTCWAETF